MCITPTDSKKKKITQTHSRFEYTDTHEFSLPLFFPVLFHILVVACIYSIFDLISIAALNLAFIRNFSFVSKVNLKNSEIDADFSLLFSSFFVVGTFDFMCVSSMLFNFFCCSVYQCVLQVTPSIARVHPQNAKVTLRKSNREKNNQRIYFIHTELLLVVQRNACCLYILYSLSVLIIFRCACTRVSVCECARVYASVFVSDMCTVIVIVLDQRTHKYQRTRTHTRTKQQRIRVCMGPVLWVRLCETNAECAYFICFVLSKTVLIVPHIAHSRCLCYTTE